MALEKLGASIDVGRYVKEQNGVLVGAQEKNRYVSTPEQLRALQLCQALEDPGHKIYYLSLCKRLRPEIIDAADSFVRDAHARSRAKLFMWKIKQLTRDYQQKGLDPHRADATPTKKRKKPKTPSAGEQEMLF